MEHRCISGESWRVGRCLLAMLTLAIVPCSGVAQNTPLISGGIGFLGESTQDVKTLQPVLAPVIAAPLGWHLLVESRGDIRQYYQQDSNGVYQGQFIATLPYLQLDYLANSHLTVTGGKFLTPFGTYNERLSAVWIPYFQDPPLIFGIGTRSSGSSNGGMARGVIVARPKIQLNYVIYVSGYSNHHNFEAARTAGMQAALDFPAARLEIGTSYQRFRQGVHNDSVGAHVWWMPAHSAFELRSEYAHGARSQGYWVETAYRFTHLGGPNSLVGRFQPVFRMQQTFRNQANFPGQSDTLPSVDTKRVDFGFNYHLPSEVRLYTSYAHTFGKIENGTLGLSLTYRFLFPAWRGHK